MMSTTSATIVQEEEGTGQGMVGAAPKLQEVTLRVVETSVHGRKNQEEENTETTVRVGKLGLLGMEGNIRLIVIAIGDIRTAGMKMTITSMKMTTQVDFIGQIDMVVEIAIEKDTVQVNTSLKYRLIISLFSISLTIL